MAANATVSLSPAAAASIGAQASREAKLSTARGEVQLSPRELGIVMVYLCYDTDEEIRALARRRMLELSEFTLLEIVAQDDAHPKVLDLIARCHYLKPQLVERLQAHPSLADTTSIFLTEKSVVDIASTVAVNPLPVIAVAASSPAEASPDEEEEYDEEVEEHHSKYQLAQIIGVGEKIKLALTGDKEWRSILIKDSNKQISGAVIKNPRISESEVLAIVKSSIQNDEILRVICSNKEWVKNNQIRKALVENHRTPLPTALRYLSTMSDKDLATLAKSKSVSTVIATQARRLLMQKKKD